MGLLVLYPVRLGGTPGENPHGGNRVVGEVGRLLDPHVAHEVATSLAVASASSGTNR